MEKERKFEIAFLLCVYLLGLVLRLYPKLAVSSRLPSFMGDVWYRICMAQYMLDHGSLPIPDIRYLAYGYVPMWYPPLSPAFLAFLSKITTLDLATVCTRIMPFFEAFTPIPFYFLIKKWYNGQIARISVLIFALTPSFIYLTGIADLQIFTLWIIPVALLFLSKEYTHKRAIILGILLGINFLFHLSYFLTLVTLILYIAAEKIEKKPIKEKVKFFLISTGISLLVTAWWWLPDNLFKWWIFHVSASTLLQGIRGHLEFYGALFMILGFIGFAYFCTKKFKHRTFIVLWTVFLFYEVFAENILDILDRADLMWVTVIRPLEGYRFYIFLAMPFSLVSALFLDRIRKDLDREVLGIAFVAAITVISLTGISSYNIEWKLTNSGVNEREYDAALWFRENTSEDARIVADYYTAQMFGGVCGGKALLGGLFPLRNIDFNEYIKAPAQVQDDIYELYSSDDMDLTLKIIERYGITHIFISRNMESSGWFGAYKADGFGIPVNHVKFRNDKYFKLVYSDGNIEIYEIMQYEP
ncbi:MAG: glycosyltransferase family 39 protein [Euryarchaeota archaeon]|nr:glycosyltransferase family 39 protein [Euryarchaeota archaeon]